MQMPRCAALLIRVINRDLDIPCGWGVGARLYNLELKRNVVIRAQSCPVHTCLTVNIAVRMSESCDVDSQLLTSRSRCSWILQLIKTRTKSFRLLVAVETWFGSPL